MPQFQQHRKLRLRLRECIPQPLQIRQRRHQRLLRNDMHPALHQRQQLLDTPAAFPRHAAHIHHRMLHQMPPLLISLRLRQQRVLLPQRSHQPRILLRHRHDFHIAQQLRPRQHCADMSFESDECEFHELQVDLESGIGVREPGSGRTLTPVPHASTRGPPPLQCRR